MIKNIINSCLPKLEKDLLLEIEAYGVLKLFPAKNFIIKQGQYIRLLPIVVRGHVKVFSEEDTMQFLLYYISPGEPCIFSFAHLLNEKPIEFSAYTESDSELLMLPIDQVNQWLKKYPSFSNLLLQSYQKHYQDLLHTTKQVICFKLEKRLLDYLNTKSALNQSNTLSISHQEIAADLGTSREVISRIMKKMGQDKKLVQLGRKIKLL